MKELRVFKICEGEVSAWRIKMIAISIGLAAFAGGVVLDWLLLPDRRALLYSDGFTAIVVGILAYYSIKHYVATQRLMLARKRVLSDVNHHVRNALVAISYCVYVCKDSRVQRYAQEAVNRIDWTLREVLSRIPPRSQTTIAGHGFPLVAPTAFPTTERTSTSVDGA